jgi:NADP-dependent 3-hydroxy acid dehydrogenase YdfG
MMVCGYLEGIMIMSKVWFITGTRSGIGAEYANVALQAGYRVAGATGFKSAAVYSATKFARGSVPNSIGEYMGGKNAKA